jgi:pimeloyl-ACP methyl ester carboxylesterase
MGEENIREIGAALGGEGSLRAYLEAEWPLVVGVSASELAQTMDSLLPPVDRELVTGELAEDMVESHTSALAPGVDGWTDDDLAFTRAWGFDLAALRNRPVSIWQGGVDLMVPAAHGRWLAGAVPGAREHFLPDDGHLSIVVALFDEILTELLESL